MCQMLGAKWRSRSTCQLPCWTKAGLSGVDFWTKYLSSLHWLHGKQLLHLHLDSRLSRFGFDSFGARWLGRWHPGANPRSLTQFMPATNNIAPNTAQERVFAILIVLIGLAVFSSFAARRIEAVSFGRVFLGRGGRWAGRFFAMPCAKGWVQGNHLAGIQGNQLDTVEDSPV